MIRYGGMQRNSVNVDFIAGRYIRAADGILKVEAQKEGKIP